MTEDQIKERLSVCHEQERKLNLEIGKLDKIILTSNKRKKKVASMISRNVKYRNNLITQLPKKQENEDIH